MKRYTVKISPKIKRFIAEYLKDQNGKQAAIRAGYSKRTANEQASALLAKLNVRAAVDEALEEIKEKSLADRVYVLSALKEVAERCMTRTPVLEFDYAEKELVKKQILDKETGKMIGVYEFDSQGANKALELLGKNLKLFIERSEVTGRNGKDLIPEGKAPVDLSKMTDEQLEMMGTNIAAIIAAAKPEQNAPHQTA